MLITFVNRLDPDQAWQNDEPDLDPICLTLRWYSRKFFFEKVDFEKIQQTIKDMKKLPGGKDLKCYIKFSLCRILFPDY